MVLSFDAKRFFHNSRGLGNYSRDIIRLLMAYYPENDYVLFNPKPLEKALYSPPPHANVIVPKSFFYKTFPGLWRSKGSLADIRKVGTDIFHGLNQELPQGIHKTKIKTVVTIHDAIFIRFPELYDSFYRKIFTAKNKYSCRVADRIIAISEQSKADAIEFFDADPSKIDVVYQGCNAIFRETITQENINAIRQKHKLPEHFLLYVGAIEKRKNIELIINALSIGKITTPLVIIGSKSKYYEHIFHLVTKLNLENQVFFLHGIPTEDLPVIYKSADIFIYPSIFEGFGIPILEALCTGTPVITSNGSCFAETGGDAAAYIHPDNPEELAEVIKTILSSEKKQGEMRQKGFLHAQQFSDEKIAKNIMQVYARLT